jgi:hypothetical protein
MEVDSAESESMERLPFIVAPLIHEMGTNVTQLAEKRVGPVPPEFAALAQHLKRFGDFTQPSLGTDCSLFPAVQEIIANFVLPPDGGLPMPNVSWVPCLRTFKTLIAVMIRFYTEFLPN